MPRYVAFLRAVNVGGPRTIKMDVLRLIFEGLGFSAVSTFIASGNVIFETPRRKPAELEEKIERGLIEALGYDATPFVRTGPELKEIAAFEAFPQKSVGAKDQLGIIFLTTPLEAGVTRILAAAPTQAEEFCVHGRQVYWLRHRDAAGEVYPTVLIDKTIIDQPFTIRSIGTVRKIAEKYFS